MQLVDFLSSKLEKTPQEIEKFALTAPKMYKIYTIPKRKAGHRIIAHPSKNLKYYQHLVIDFIRIKLPIHGAAQAYKTGHSIKTNALAHINGEYLLKMDFNNFFNSITPELFSLECAKRNIELTRSELSLIKKLIFWNPSKKKGGKLILSVGAPTSPLISNFIMYGFDYLLSEYCYKNDISYTRYADDLTFSTRKKNNLFHIPSIVKDFLSAEFNKRISVNESKTIFSSKAHNRHITGVTLTTENKLSVGRERKRYIYSLLHSFSLGNMAKPDIEHLQGLFSFACHIDETFKSRAENKYSKLIISQLHEGRFNNEK
ncbi:retron St85 family RNA-directed DNA polymerase [Aeromonas rivipollensis]|uniref:retron St85 family RNA-directed DNA polymerase n=1 Tax=Aeromonas rivipollensis TaxID=948519 RepID=UPI0038D0F74A